jgi:anti-sigma regulatory factor (Ser/Thr protein kinase)
MQQGPDPSSRSEEHFESSFPASIDALVEPRQSFGSWLERRGVPADVSSELKVVFSELTSNAAAVTDDVRADIRTRAWCEGTDVVITVQNPPQDDQLVVRHWDLDDALRGGGRGLVIVRAYTDDVQADTGPGGALTIRCRRRVTT